MIVTPEFLDHWKTRMLVNELQGDETAPLLILRLWAHCQVKKTHRLGRVSAGALKSICRFKGAHEVLWLAMQNSGFICVKNEQVEVHDWAIYNAGLITSWNNGRKGGRPRKPAGNPQVTRRQPASNPLETDKIGEDRRGLDEIGIHSNLEPPAASRPRNLPLDALVIHAEATNIEHATKDLWGKAAKALSIIRQVSPGVTAENIAEACINYRTHFDSILTCTALAAHWGRCQQIKTPQSNPNERIYRSEMAK